MAAITWADVVAVAPELALIDVIAQDFFLDYVNSQFDVSLLDGEDGPRTRLARIFLAAHLATLSRRGRTSSSGPVIEEALGPQSRKYADITEHYDSLLASTPYGLMYLSVINTSNARGPLVI
jgi:hypothetical protein